MRNIYSVSELTAEIKALLEQKYPFVWIFGEISNFRRPSSGHFYFTLKDDRAQISGVMFRGQQGSLKFRPEDGMEITGMGRIGLYEPRGAYQIILEYMEPRGIGALQKAFEQLKEKLASEGLFEERHKKPIPFLPRKIVLITSSTGAVVHDMIHIIRRRFENIPIGILPVRVQGDGSEEQISEAIALLDDLEGVDVAILARGGGSLEDLQAFNSERVARAIFSCNVPVISAIGHETDYTISDFVADLRAPTPSAAAELVVPVKRELARRCMELSGALSLSMLRTVDGWRERVMNLGRRLVHPRARIQDFRLRLDDLFNRMVWHMENRLARSRERLEWRLEKLWANTPSGTIEKLKVKLEQIQNNLSVYIKIVLEKKRNELYHATSRLEGANPSAILERGYSVTRTIPEGDILRDAADAAVGQSLSIRLARGELACRVEEKKST